VRDRFISKFEKGQLDDCWPWLAGKLRAGYGIFHISHRKPRLAHRMMWELENGQIPAGLDVLHKCDNPPCVNPNHLFLGTQRDNGQDMARKGRSYRGPRPWCRKFFDMEIEAIRKMRDEDWPFRTIAKQFDCNESSIRQICSHKSYKEII